MVARWRPDASREEQRVIALTSDQMSAAGAFIAREWGPEGYTVEAVESMGPRVSAFRVRCSDGGRFFVLADRWGNTAGVVPDGASSVDGTFNNPDLLARAAQMVTTAAGA
jgi:hypothetical protein